MPPITPDQGQLLLQLALRSLKLEHATTRRVIESIPEDQGLFRPDEIAKPALDLAWHIAVSEIRFLDAVCNGKFEFTGGIRPETMETPQAISEWYAAKFDAARVRLEALGGEQLVQIVDFRGMLQMPAVLFLQLGLSHSIHHRGQLSMYLRPMGAKVPSIYGESHDAAEARRNAEAAR